MASPVLFRRWQALVGRALWLLLAALFTVYLLVLNLLTQLKDEKNQLFATTLSLI